MSKNYLVIVSSSSIGKEIMARILKTGHRLYSVSRGERDDNSANIHHLTWYVSTEASAHIMALLNLDHKTNYCNIELRSEGIIEGFRSILDTYAWIVAYSRLSISRSLGEVSFYSGEHFMRLLSIDKSKSHVTFIRRLIRLKAEASRDLSPY